MKTDWKPETDPIILELLQKAANKTSPSEDELFQDILVLPREDPRWEEINKIHKSPYWDKSVVSQTWGGKTKVWCPPAHNNCVADEFRSVIWWIDFTNERLANEAGEFEKVILKEHYTESHEQNLVLYEATDYNYNSNWTMALPTTYAASPILRATRPELSLAFFIQVSESNLHMFPRMFNKIYHDKNVYAIHFDKHVSEQDMEEALKNIGFKQSNNVILLPREKVSYWGISMLLNTISAITELLDKSSHWDYFINLSAADYPLITPSKLRQLFAQAAGEPEYNFIQVLGANAARDHDYRVKQIHFDPALFDAEGNDLYTISDRSHPYARQDNMNIQKGEAWMILSRSFCRYVTREMDPKRYLIRFATASASDELYFQTVFWNSPYRPTIVNRIFRAIFWFHPLNGTSGARPYNLDQASLFYDYIRCTGALFARKFMDTNSETLAIIDRELLNESSDISQQYYDEISRQFLYVTADTRKRMNKLRWKDPFYNQYHS
ncbi:Beta-glucuronosyltransferase GlcAT14B [Galdieria sulphuraria]|nr:Beta-glucuronosyltransferase GlcAT14B [Galdieria sulphuraria]